MQSLIQWVLGLMNPLTIVAALVSFGIGYFVKNLVYARVKDTLKDVEQFLHDLNKGGEDDKWTKDEIAALWADVKHIQGDYKK